MHVEHRSVGHSNATATPNAVGEEEESTGRRQHRIPHRRIYTVALCHACDRVRLALGTNETGYTVSPSCAFPRAEAVLA